MVVESSDFSNHQFLKEPIAASCGSHGQQHWWITALGWACLVWCAAVTVVCWIGYIQIQRHFRRLPRRAVSTSTLPPSQIPHVTIIRPIKGLEPCLYECLAAALRQDYPSDKLTVYFCLSSVHDPAFPVVRKLLADFPDADTKLFIEPEYADAELGPNPKIRNMSRAYREAKSDIVWILDCNVWLGKGVCGRMVDRLCGFDSQRNGGRKYKFVHHLPIVVDVDASQPIRPLLADDVDNRSAKTSRLTRVTPSVLAKGGGRLEELFLASAHAKMYTAINTVLVAPCIIGKSSMFRRSHLNYLTDHTSGARPYRLPRRPGIDYFSDNICEDHLVGDRLWKGKVLEEAEYGESWGKHDLAFGDLAIQPMSGMSVGAYIDRRVRWLRVRKFTVLLATLVEPGTESFLCSAYLAFGVNTVLPKYFPSSCATLGSWKAYLAVWLLNVVIWIIMDWTVYLRLHSGATVEVDEHTPSFARPLPHGRLARRTFKEWFLAWLGREALALPIWIWSFYGGTRVVWRGRAFKVGIDMVAREIADDLDAGRKRPLASQFPAGDIEAVNGEGKYLRRRTPNGSFTKPDVSNADFEGHAPPPLRN
ncbi:hypothetical protein VTO42DRAFT_6403 [Malbranchea cinnamomea]